jgi:hypothetical protein
MLMPSWKYALNYETKWMNRDEIVRATYDGALGLLNVKEKYGAISQMTAAKVRNHLERAVALNAKIKDLSSIDDSLREEIFSLNTLDLVCDKHELDWPIKGWKLNVFKLAKLLMQNSHNGNGNGSCQGQMTAVPVLATEKERLFK